MTHPRGGGGWRIRQAQGLSCLQCKVLGGQGQQVLQRWSWPRGSWSPTDGWLFIRSWPANSSLLHIHKLTLQKCSAVLLLEKGGEPGPETDITKTKTCMLPIARRIVWNSQIINKNIMLGEEKRKKLKRQWFIFDLMESRMPRYAHFSVPCGR